MKKMLALLSLLTFATASPAQLSTSGTGTVAVAPDHATVSILVITENSSAALASQANAKAAAGVFSGLAEYGPKAPDVKSTSFNIRRTFDDKNAFRCYTATHAISAKVRDLSKLGTVLDKVVGNSVTVSSVRFEVEDRDASETAARKAALAQAKKKAEQMANNLGFTLGNVRSVSDSSSHPSYYSGASLENAARSATTVVPGDQNVTVTVSVTWDIIPADYKSPNPLRPASDTPALRFIGN